METYKKQIGRFDAAPAHAHTPLPMRNILFAATLALVAAGGGGPGGDASPDALQLASNDDLASTISSLGDKTLFLRMFMNG